MKTNKIIYWAATILLAAFMLMSGVMYLTKPPQMEASLKAIGIPYFIMQFLGVAKILGAVALVFPKWPKLKEWAYAGFTFTFLGAMWVHFITNTPSPIGPFIALLVLVVSYVFWNKIQQGNTQPA